MTTYDDPPFDLDTELNLPTDEQALLGAVLCGYPDFPDLLPVITATDFAHPAHEDVWNAMCAVHQAGGVSDPHTVRAALGTRANTLPGGPVYLHTLMGTATVAESAPWYARQVVAQARTRLIRTVGTRLVQLSEDTDPDSALERARQLLDDAADGKRAAGLTHIADALLAVITGFDTEKDAGWNTPWPDLDRYIEGLKAGQLVVVAARPSVGKSLMLTNIAVHHAKVHNQPTYLGSLEMSTEDLTCRALASEARVNLSRLMANKPTPEERDLADQAYVNWLNWPMHVFDEARQSVAITRTNVRELNRQGAGITLVCLDYLQLMKSDDRLPREQQVAVMTRELKIMARELNVCVVLAAQLNRKSLDRADGKPNLGDLRESGAIEQDADVVILLHRPDENLPEVTALVAKNRNGPTGSANLLVQGHFARFTSTTSRNY